MDEHSDYEALLLAFYAYQFKTISFLELVERLELALHIRPSDQAEVPDGNIAALQREGD